MEVYRTDICQKWLDGLKDVASKIRILQRIDRIKLGNLGHIREVATKVFELKFDFGPGYRVYCTRHGKQIVLLLAGGDKSTQKRDIKKAAKMVEEIDWSDYESENL
jgi:putative addiction module killer protein